VVYPWESELIKVGERDVAETGKEAHIQQKELK
jgi:hypothetical protein